LVYLRREPPYSAEIKDLITVLESLKTSDGLWPSRVRRATDLFISAIVLWLTGETYKKIGMYSKIKASYESLIRAILLKLHDKPKENITHEELYELGQCLTSLLNLEEKLTSLTWFDDLINYTHNVFSHDKVEELINLYTPYYHSISSISVLSMLVLHLYSKPGNISESVNKLDIVINRYLEKLIVEDTKNIDPAAFYWMTETLKQLIQRRKIAKKFHSRLSVKELVDIICGKLPLLKMNMNLSELTPLDYTLWFFLSEENIIEISKLVKREINSQMLKEHDQLAKQILNKGRIFWLKSAYGECIYDARMRECATAEEVKFTTLDLITLSLLIKTYERIGKHVVTYITDADLRKLRGVERVSFALATILIIVGTMFLSYSTPLLHIALTYNLPSYLTLDRLLITALFTIAPGLAIMYSLIRGKIKKYSDILLIIISIVNKLKSLSKMAR